MVTLHGALASAGVYRTVKLVLPPARANTAWSRNHGNPPIATTPPRDRDRGKRDHPGGGVVAAMVVHPAAVRDPAASGHGCDHAVFARASGSTNFTVLYTPALAGAPMSPLYQEHQSRHAICARFSGIANFTVRKTPAVLVGTLNSPFYQE